MRLVLENCFEQGASFRESDVVTMVVSLSKKGNGFREDQFRQATSLHVFVFVLVVHDNKINQSDLLF